MISHSRSFVKLKNATQKVFDFAIVVSYAVPALKYALKGLAHDSQIPFKPEHFQSRPTSTAKVRENSKEYKTLLSKYIFLSSFSYFEAYFHDLIKEVVEFHGKKRLKGQTSISPNLANTNPEVSKLKKKLQEYMKPTELLKYRKAQAGLIQLGFRFPSALLASYGLDKLVSLAEGEYIPSSMIPDLTSAVFQLPLDPTLEIEKFGKYRDLRNRIAHGRASIRNLNLPNAIEANNFLRNLALKIDRHIVEHFLILEGT